MCVVKRSCNVKLKRKRLNLVKKKLKKLLSKLSGETKSFSLEHRLFNIMILMAIAISYTGAFRNYLMGLPAITIYPSVIAGVIAFIYYYRSRFIGIYKNYFVYILASLTILIVSVIFFSNSGSAGPVIIVHICLFNVYMLISNGRNQYIILFLLLVHVTLLYYLEWIHPEWVKYYQTKEDRFTDVLPTFSFAVIFMSVTTIIFKKNYNRERKLVEGKNTELENSLIEINKKNEFIYSLMREINHRVKNNLQLVTSLLNMQENIAKNEKIKSSLNLAKSRIISIGLIHQKLYKDNLELHLELSDYINELTNYIIRAALPLHTIKLTTNLEHIEADVETAVHIGLIVNELITNSIKHAWSKSDNDNQISIKSKLNGNTFHLFVSDNGTGINEGAKKNTDSMGLGLIQSIVEQYEGNLQIMNNNGAKFKITMKMPNYSKNA